MHFRDTADTKAGNELAVLQERNINTSRPLLITGGVLARGGGAGGDGVEEDQAACRSTEAYSNTLHTPETRSRRQSSTLRLLTPKQLTSIFSQFTADVSVASWGSRREKKGSSSSGGVRPKTAVERQTCLT